MGGRETEEIGGGRQNKGRKRKEKGERRKMRVRGRKRERGVEDGVTHECM